MRRIVQKHGKIMMTVLGVVLMVVFALPTMSGGSSDNSGVKAGTLNGKKLTYGDLSYANSEMYIISQLQGENVVKGLGLDTRDEALHWTLLVREAAKYGLDTLVLGEEQIISDIRQRASRDSQRAAMMGIYLDVPSEASLKAAITNLGSSRVLAAYNRLYAIYGLYGFVNDVPVSMSAFELAAEQNQSRVQVAYATFDAAKGWEAMPEPTDEQIRKQFELYKNVVASPLPTSAAADRGPEPAEVDGHRYPFGYKYPDRVTVEYLVIDRQALRDTLKPTPEDYKEAYAYYREHPEEFKNDPASTNPATSPATSPSTGPATGPGTTGPATAAASRPAIKPFDEIKEARVRTQIETRLTQQIKALTERAVIKASEPWKAADSVPLDKWVKYQELADDLARRTDNFKPTVKVIDTLMSAEELALVPGIGKATNEQKTLPFPVLATHVREMSAGRTTKDPLARLSLQVGVEGPPLLDEAGNVYIYRVTAVEQSREPKTLEEVKPRIVEDLKKLANYQRLVKEATDLAEASRNLDLTAMAKLKNVTVEKSVEFTQTIEVPIEIKNIRNFVKQSFTMVPPGIKAPATAAASGTQSPGVGNTTLLSDDSALRAYTLQLLSVRPAVAAAFGEQLQRELTNMAMPQLVETARADAQLAFGNFLSLDNVMARMKYKPEQPLPPAEE